MKKHRKKKPAPPKDIDLDHRDAREALDHCPCWYEGKLCCFCGEEKPACPSYSEEP